MVRKKVKCLVWDLDNTLWDGVLLEGDPVRLRNKVREVLGTLDGRGILHSIASKNDRTWAGEKLREFGLDPYFLYPQINWNAKSSSIEKICRSLNIGIDTLAFVDDDPAEREEVKFAHPEVLCIDAADLERVPAMPEMSPRFITEDSKRRREMYLEDMARRKEEEEFVGAKEEFLRTLDMVMTISEASEADLKRAEELTVRTHQLNTTGYTYSYDELDRFRKSDQHRLLLATLEDRFGAYGKIGLALVEAKEDVWTIKLLLMSCRVLSRGVGSIMISHIRNQARERGVRLCAEMISNERNRMMYMAFKFAHFKEKKKTSGLILFENDLEKTLRFPDYVQVKIRD
jgi:FkbH-like protein